MEFVKTTLPAGYVFTASNVIDDGVDSDADPGTGRSGIISLGVGQHDPTIDAGTVMPPANYAAIGNRVWIDSNADGQQTGGEPGLAGVKVTLFNAGGIPAGETLTDATGTTCSTSSSQATTRFSSRCRQITWQQ